MWKNAIFSIFSAVRFLATVMLLNLALRKCWKYQCQFLNVSKTKKKSQKALFLTFYEKKMYYEIPLSMWVQDSECCILLLLDTGCSLCTSWKLIVNGFMSKIKISVFKSNLTISFFLKKKLGTLPKLVLAYQKELCSF